MELCTNIKIQCNVGREKDISSSRRRFRVVGGVGHCRLANLLTHYDVPSSKNQCKIIFHVAKGCVSWLLHPFFSEYSWYLGRLWKVIDFHRHHCQWMYAWKVTIATNGMVMNFRGATTAHCALWAVRWPCSILAIAVKNTFSWENNIFEAIFPMLF